MMISSNEVIPDDTLIRLNETKHSYFLCILITNILSREMFCHTTCV